MAVTSHAALVVEDRVLSVLNSTAGRQAVACKQKGLRSLMPLLAVAARAGLLEAGGRDFEINIKVDEVAHHVDIRAAAKRPVDQIEVHLEI